MIQHVQTNKTVPETLIFYADKMPRQILSFVLSTACTLDKLTVVLTDIINFGAKNDGKTCT